MLLTEWNQDEALEVAREEGREEGREDGLEEGRKEGIGIGLSQGREEGEEIGIGKGMEKEKLIIAKNLLSEGSTPEFVCRITGLSAEQIEAL